MKYIDCIKESMNLLAKEGYIFIGQSCLYPGTGLYHTIKHIPKEQRYELPVFEDIQSGISIGMALEGLKVCSVYPRWDFLLLAANQIVNHWDKIKYMSDSQFDPFFIIRTAVGSQRPLFPGKQHTQNHTKAFKQMLETIKIYELKNKKNIVKTYKKIMDEKIPAIVVEFPDLYET